MGPEDENLSGDPAEEQDAKDIGQASDDDWAWERMVTLLGDE